MSYDWTVQTLTLLLGPRQHDDCGDAEDDDNIMVATTMQVRKQHDVDG